MHCKGSCDNKKSCCNKDGCHSNEAVCQTTRDKLLEELGGWTISLTEPQRLMKTYDFENFVDALRFVNKVGVVAEEMNHHPNICLEWGKVGVEIWTHAVNDLTELDFILARKIDNTDRNWSARET